MAQKVSELARLQGEIDRLSAVNDNVIEAMELLAGKVEALERIVHSSGLQHATHELSPEGVWIPRAAGVS